MKLRTKALILQAPAIIILVLAFVGSLILKILGDYPLNWFTPLFLVIILVLYFLGRVLEEDTEIRKH